MGIFIDNVLRILPKTCGHTDDPVHTSHVAILVIVNITSVMTNTM